MSVDDNVGTLEVVNAIPYDDVYLIVRAYNEAPVIGSVLAALKTVFRKIVVVDDGSKDDTSKIAKEHRIPVVRHSVNLGAGAALQTGIEYCLERNADWIVTFDADGQHKVEDAIDILKRLIESKGEVIIGSRFLGSSINMPRHRFFVLKFAVSLARFLDRSPLTDAHNGLRAFSKHAASILNIRQSGMAYASEIIGQWESAGIEIKEAPVTIEYTDYSLSKGQSSLNAINIALDLLLGRFLR